MDISIWIWVCSFVCIVMVIANTYDWSCMIYVLCISNNIYLDFFYYFVLWLMRIHNLNPYHMLSIFSKDNMTVCSYSFLHKCTKTFFFPFPSPWHSVWILNLMNHLWFYLLIKKKIKFLSQHKEISDWRYIQAYRQPAVINFHFQKTGGTVENFICTDA